MIHVGAEVAHALAAHEPVVALESTIFSTLGLPAPANAQALTAVLEAVRAAGAVPALTAVLDGVATVGVDELAHERVLGGTRKVASRDLGVAAATKTDVGVTTVSAALTLAAATGIDVFATGGIGGVHRDVAQTGDVSADLVELSRRSVVTVCAGAKAFLDLPRTLEALETLGVPVLGWRTDELPAFWSARSGSPVPHTVHDAAEVARVLGSQRAFGRPQGVVVAVPVPAASALDPEAVERATDAATRRAEAAGVRGSAVTPFVLAEIARLTGGRTVAANIALASNNAAVAAEIASRLAS